jgi:hypothetical protein|tara:strand:- start:564 stop:989 length:426 start_codon:yes stop_codon:yes gene_type:complete
MQTFLPYKSFDESAQALDYKRLGKQRVEAMQIFNALTGIPTKSGKAYTGWLNHPAVVMWKGYEEALLLYKNKMIEEWILRGYNNTMEMIGVSDDVTMPHWLGSNRLHASHRSNLLRKDYKFYSQYNWKESNDLEYYWVDDD